MICDTVSNIGVYRGISNGLDCVIDWLSQNSLDDLPLGRTELDGDKVFVNVMEAQTRPLEGTKYEVHAKYMDLQVDITGQEGFFVAQRRPLGADFDAEKDIGFYDGEPTYTGNLGEGRFVLFLSKEPHMPTLRLQNSSDTVKKAVFKILDDTKA